MKRTNELLSPSLFLDRYIAAPDQGSYEVLFSDGRVQQSTIKPSTGSSLALYWRLVGEVGWNIIPHCTSKHGTGIFEKRKIA